MSPLFPSSVALGKLLKFSCLVWKMGKIRVLVLQGCEEAYLSHFMGSPSTVLTYNIVDVT